MFAHALVAVDGSAQSDYALSLFLKTIDAKRTKVTVLYVIAPSRYVVAEEALRYSGTPSLHRLQERLVQQEEESVRSRVKMISEDESVPVEMIVRIGDPRDEILAAAEEVDASLIVMGSTGKGLGERILLGSVSTYVTVHSPISTMIIR